MLKDTHIEKIIITGPRIASRMSIWYAFCRLVTSVVSRVTIEAEENLSIFENAKVCTLSYISCLRFAAKPAAAFAPMRAAPIPVVSCKSANMNSAAP